MEYCSKCFKKMCRCGRLKVEIDYYIYPAVYELNRKGYTTNSCCSGHEGEPHIGTYISFDMELDIDIDSEYFQFDSYNYRGFHERRNCIRLKPDVVQKFKKKRTNKLALIQAVNKDLYAWAKSLPNRSLSDIKAIDLPADYFDKEVERDEVIDVQKPWILFAKAAEGCRYTADDFFNEIEPDGQLTELIVNRSGRIKKFCERDYASYESSSFLRGKIEFDVSGDYRHLLVGYEPYATIEKLLIGEAGWYLSYARTDIAVEYGDAAGQPRIDDFEEFDDDYPGKGVVVAKMPAHIETLFDEDDIEDFKDEHPDKSEIDLFAFFFNRMCRMNINTCVFSADNINIVFSNRTDFSLLMTNEQNVFAFGDADYEYMDFSHIHVERKEVFVYANGRLLLRQEVE